MNNDKKTIVNALIAWGAIKELAKYLGVDSNEVAINLAQINRQQIINALETNVDFNVLDLTSQKELLGIDYEKYKCLIL